MVQFADERVGEFDTQLVEHTYQSLANNSGMTLHVRKVGRHRLASAREKEKLPDVHVVSCLSFCRIETAPQTECGLGSQ